MRVKEWLFFAPPHPSHPPSYWDSLAMEGFKTGPDQKKKKKKKKMKISFSNMPPAYMTTTNTKNVQNKAKIYI